jgi:hypothetical protein
VQVVAALAARRVVRRTRCCVRQYGRWWARWRDVVRVDQLGRPAAPAVHEATELHTRQRHPFQSSPPRVPGTNAAGIIDDLGLSLPRWEVGDEVFAECSSG